MTQKKNPTQTSDQNTKEKEPHKLILILAPIALLIASFFLVRTAMDKVLVNAMDAFKASEDEMTAQTYENAAELYKAAADKTKLRTITPGPLKQQEKIEVYRIPAEQFIVENKGDNEYGITSWIALKETAVYTANPSLSDFIVDEEREIITIRIPKLEVEFIEDEENIEKLFERQDGEVQNDTDPDEAKRIIEERMTGRGRMSILEAIHNNDDYTDAAKEAAEQIFTGLLKSLNPDHDLHVVVKIGEED